MQLRTLAPLLIALCAFSICAGQTPQTQPTREQRQFRITTIGKRIQNAGYALQDGSLQAIRLSPSYIAGPYTYSSKPIKIFQTDANGQRSLIALAAIAEGIRNPLLLLVDIPAPFAEGETLPFTALAIDDSLQSAPVNSVRVLNLTGANIAASLAKRKPEMIASGGQLIIPFEVPSPADSYRTLDIALQEPNGSWQRLGPVRENEIYLEDGCRYLVIVTPSDGQPSAPATVTTVRDALPARALKSLLSTTPH